METEIKPAIKLPDKPSELIRVAINDLIMVEKSPKYTVDMGDWHEPVYMGSPDSIRCNVCLAGSVIACTLQADPSEEMYPSSFDNDTEAKLEALNEFRVGSVEWPLRDMGIDTDDFSIPEERNIVDYAADPILFKEQILELADELEAIGL
jgi:hypothetical protein